MIEINVHTAEANFTFGMTWFEKVRVVDETVPFNVDTGAQIDVLPWSVVRKIDPKTELRRTNISLTAFGGQRIKPLGMCSLPCEYNNVKQNVWIAVVDLDVVPILGLATCVKFGIVDPPRSSYNANNVRQSQLWLSTLVAKLDKEFILTKYAELFKGLGTFEKEYKILIKENAQPVAYAPRKVPHALKDKLKRKLDDLEKNGIIEKANAYCEWVSHLVYVNKKDVEKSLRICIDPSELNKNILEEQVYIPTFEEFASDMAGMKYFSV